MLSKVDTKETGIKLKDFYSLCCDVVKGNSIYAAFSNVTIKIIILVSF